MNYMEAEWTSAEGRWVRVLFWGWFKKRRCASWLIKRTRDGFVLADQPRVVDGSLQATMLRRSVR